MPYRDLLPLLTGTLVRVEGSDLLLLYFADAADGTYHLTVRSLELFLN